MKNTQNQITEQNGESDSRMLEEMLDSELSLLGDLNHLSFPLEGINEKNRQQVLARYVEVSYINSLVIFDTYIPRTLDKMEEKYGKSEKCHLKIADKFFELGAGKLRIGTIWGDDDAKRAIERAIWIYEQRGHKQEGLEKAAEIYDSGGKGFLAAHYYKRIGKLDKAKKAIEPEQAKLRLSAAIVGIANRDLSYKMEKLADSFKENLEE